MAFSDVKYILRKEIKPLAILTKTGFKSGVLSLVSKPRIGRYLFVDYAHQYNDEPSRKPMLHQVIKIIVYNKIPITTAMFTYYDNTQ